MMPIAPVHQRPIFLDTDRGLSAIELRAPGRVR